MNQEAPIVRLIVFTRLVDVLLFIALACCWLGLLGGWTWWLDLFSHFKAQQLVISALAFVWFAMMRNRTGIVIATATVLMCAGFLLLTGWPMDKTTIGPGKTLRVLSLNVLTSNSRKREVLEYLRSSDADVIFVMEMNSAWVNALKPLQTSHPHFLTHPREDNFGVALYSRLPARDMKLVNVGAIGLPTVSAEVMIDDKPITIIATHPLPPVDARNSGLRDGQLLDIAALVSSMSNPVLLIGDLNTTPWSRGMRILRGNSALDFHSTQRPWQPTWQADTILAIPIDHALTTLPLMIASLTIGPDIGSDHLPLVLEVCFAK